MKQLIFGNVPPYIRRKTFYNMKKYHLIINDAFNYAILDGMERNKMDSMPDINLYNAWYTQDFRLYIPSAYIPKYLDLEMYPLAYETIKL